MRATLYCADGTHVRFGTRLGKGGEGEVYAVEGTTDIAAKLYTCRDVSEREAKVRRMISENLAERFKLIAFPISLLRDKAGRFVGFTMAKVGGAKALHELYSPGARKAAFPRADYRFLVRTASNIARAIAACHSAGCIIGDINHSGVLVSDRATATLIDADSFQIIDGGRRLACKVGVPEYTPPELQGVNLETVTRTQNHDAFGLAVVIFQLLWMGRHPFSGRPTGGGDIPIEKAIREFRFAYSQSRTVGMDAPPGAPSLGDFPKPIAAAFESAFGPYGTQQRPTAAHWIGLLRELEGSLKCCPANSLHYFPGEATDCPWCRMERRLGVLLFLPHFGGAVPNTPVFPVTGSVESIWHLIEGVPAPPPSAQNYNLNTPVVNTSSEAVAVHQRHLLARYGGWALVAGGVGLWFAVSGAFLVGLISAIAGAVLISKSRTTADVFIQKYKETETRFQQAAQQYVSRTSADEFEKLKSFLVSLKKEFDQLPTEQSRRISAYKANRRNEQLRAFLDGFQIQHFRIANIGPAKLAVLTSYGIETAADVTRTSVLAVPGFGPVNSKPLLEWRAKLEPRFQYNANTTPADQQAISRIYADVARRAVEIRNQLATGPERLSRVATAIRAARSGTDPTLQYLHEQRTQARCDMEYLGLSLPSIQIPAGRQTPVVTARTTLSSQSGSGPKPCPHCGGRMVLRTARRGVNAGRQFYGCSRYPSCKGTRQFP